MVWRSILREKVVLVTWTDKLDFYGLSGRGDRISRDLNLMLGFATGGLIPVPLLWFFLAKGFDLRATQPEWKE